MDASSHAASADAAEPLEFVTVKFGFNPRRSETLMLGSRWRAGRTTLLLMGAGFASIAMVDLPAPAGFATGGLAMAQAPVPASDKWIALGGVSSSSNARTAAAEPRVAPVFKMERQGARRKPRVLHIDTGRRRAS